jgi:ribulose-5-phosphate 4-epimerase/fuculose-1-phosphate aldolase
MASAAADLVEFKIEDGAPVGPESGIRWPERYIQSEIYKRFAGINCVVHSHSSDVLSFTVSGVPLKPVIHMAGFWGM